MRHSTRIGRRWISIPLALLSTFVRYLSLSRVHIFVYNHKPLPQTSSAILVGGPIDTIPTDANSG